MWAEQEEVFQEREETDLGPGVDHGGGVDQDPEGGEVTGQGVDQQEEAILKMGTDSTLEVTDIISYSLQASLIFFSFKSKPDLLANVFIFVFVNVILPLLKEGL